VSLSPRVELRPTGGLLGRALERLAEGPRSTSSLAEEVLALRGNPRAAAAAVFALLGSDPRVQVDREGNWSLTPSSGAPAEPLRGEEWVVVDVETTGGSPARGHRVIEIAAVRVSGGSIRESFSTLVNPRRPIPRMITSLTGIAGDMVADAPPFEAIAAEVGALLAGRVFVGHNAAFDWRFVCAEMERCTGRTLHGRQLCTLRLARRILAHLPSRSLGTVARYLGVEMAMQHRALDDALATAQLLLRFLERLEEDGVTSWAALDSFLARRRRSPVRSAMPRSIDAV
jgi:DNA polymerase III epsilon subunit family exonuclease